MKVEITTEGFTIDKKDYQKASASEKYNYFRQFKNALNAFINFHEHEQGETLRLEAAEHIENETEIQRAKQKKAKQSEAKIKLRETEKKRKGNK